MPTVRPVLRQSSRTSAARAMSAREVGDDDMILDIGARTAERYAEILRGAATIVWNGPVGVFEFAAFENGTRAVAEAIAGSKAFSLAGGAFLEFLEGKVLPAVQMLESRAAG